MDALSRLRNSTPIEEFDLTLLMSALKEYRQPQDKITQLIKSKKIIRIKNGLYIFGPDLARRGYVKETLANWLYGPSYISLHYALAYYQMIPERVEVITSVTSHKRYKLFKTPIGNFSYQYLHPSKFSVGIDQIMRDENHPILIATPEKALTDLLYLHPIEVKTPQELEKFLLENIRIEPETLSTLKPLQMYKIAEAFKLKRIDFLTELVLRYRGDS